jgi:aspartyl-tRNA(Asn)/glutamyl-tRNA(Gln) amidotransferase subunit C
MAVNESDVRHIAGLARLGLEPARVPALVAELNTILSHMDALSKVKTDGAQEAIGVGDGGMPLRDDGGPPLALARDLSSFAPTVKDGFIVVPRLSTHESTESDPVADDEGENVIVESTSDEEDEL